MPRTAAPPTRCLNPECDKLAIARGYCATHYRRLTRGKNPDAPDDRVHGGVQLPTIRLPPEVYEALEAQASRDGTSVYKTARDIIMGWHSQWGRYAK